MMIREGTACMLVKGAAVLLIMLPNIVTENVIHWWECATGAA